MIPSGGSPFSHMSAHNDVLQANPIQLSEKEGVVEEIKFRCKGLIKAKHYPDADVLYSKAIELYHNTEKKLDSAILHSNRSLCRSSVGKYKEAAEDALSAIDLDHSYAKGYWRLGVAYAGLERFQDAVEAYTRGLSIVSTEKEEKLWKKEIEKCQAKAKSSDSVAAKPSSSAPVKKPAPPVKKSGSSVSTAKPMEVEKLDMDDENLFTKSEKTRGYQVVNGKKTTYFHHEQTEEEKKLIGDIAPKRLTETPAPISVESTDNTSAWNKAGTWEEKDYTTVAQELLINSIMQATFKKDVEMYKVQKVRDVEGHASVAKVRGKKKCVYEYSFVIDWIAELDDVDIHGSLKYPDVDITTCSDEDDLICTDFTIVDESDYDNKMKDLVRKNVMNGLIKDVNKKIINWSNSWHTSL